jgi:hypothetical protein
MSERSLSPGVRMRSNGKGSTSLRLSDASESEEELDNDFHSCIRKLLLSNQIMNSWYVIDFQCKSTLAQVLCAF